MSRFAAAGHRVFYISQEFRDYGAPYSLTTKLPNVYEVSLIGPDRHVYTEALDHRAVDVLAASLDALRRELSLAATVAMVELPFWRPLVQRVRIQFGWPIIYDCMDYHAGFSTNRGEMLEEEAGLVTSSDCVLVSSRFLEVEVGSRAKKLLLVRNGCDYDHFAKVQSREPGPRPVVGYYGAIADWFDTDLVSDLAEGHPEWDFTLVGSTFSADLRRLGALSNVSMPGEQPYAQLPRWLEQFDVLILPFKRTPLTQATNPVKAYEILAAGKPLVSVPISEMKELAPLVRLASNVSEFDREITAALAENTAGAVEQRRAFARENTWQKRFETLSPVVRESFPPASIIIVTYNNLELNRLCLQSIFSNTEWPNFEVIVVDNGSSDGTAEFLTEAAGKYPGLKVILNKGNLGFAAASNQGLKQAVGEYLVLLNNDTAVPRNWLSALIRHLSADPKIGLIGPVTNEIGNEAKVPAGYSSLHEMPAWAAAYMREHDNEVFEIPMLAMFCVAMRRRVFEQVGFLDERFGMGMFEDDDYTRRLRGAGYQICCSRDSFVHHVGSASFRKLDTSDYFELFERNRRLFEEKWGEVWRPHEDETTKARIPALRAQLHEIVKRAGRKVIATVVFLPGESWEGFESGRSQRHAVALAKQGCLVFFDCSGSQRDMISGFSEVATRVWLYKGPGGVLDALSNPAYWARGCHAPLIKRTAKVTIIYDWDAERAARFPAGHTQLLGEAHIVLCASPNHVNEIKRARPDAIVLPDSMEQSAEIISERLRRPKPQSSVVRS